jgi:hypothetical protein
VATYLCIKSGNYYSLWFQIAGDILVQAGHESRHGLRHARTKSSETTKTMKALNKQKRNPSHAKKNLNEYITLFV